MSEKNLGIFLIILGVCISLWVVFAIIKLVDDPSGFVSFNQLIPDSEEARTVAFNNDSVKLPLELFRFLGYLLIVILIGTVASIGTKIIASGTRLLLPPKPKPEPRPIFSSPPPMESGRRRDPLFQKKPPPL